MKHVSWRSIAGLTVLAATILIFVYYFATHPATGQQLRRVSATALGLILVLYLVSIVILALITLATLRLCKVRLDNREGLLLTAYSSVINFFGPLQSGPAFRAVYLKKKHGLKLKDYGLATLVYYFFFGASSGLLLLSGLLKWWLIVPLSAAIALALAVRYSSRLKQRFQVLDLRDWYYLAAVTLAQVMLMTLIYYVELSRVAPGTSYSQTVIYTGAANLALFVSLTPGAIGFRESFLAFSQRLHHVSGTAIVAANVIDRAMYIVLLLILALFIFGSHAQRIFKAVTDTKLETK